MTNFAAEAVTVICVNPVQVDVPPAAVAYTANGVIERQ
jgi:hypothetical protein